MGYVLPACGLVSRQDVAHKHQDVAIRVDKSRGMRCGGAGIALVYLQAGHLLMASGAWVGGGGLLNA
jgi:hypothetical protein